MSQDSQPADGRLSRPVAIAIAASALVAPALVARGTNPSNDLSTRVWYAVLRKPSFNPPKFVFPIAWTAIDAALAWGAYRLARKPSTPRRNGALALFGTNVALISGWSKLFFVRHELGASAIGSAVIVTTATAYVAAARPVDEPAANAGLPLVAWVAFATLLSTSIWRLNRR